MTEVKSGFWVIAVVLGIIALASPVMAAPTIDGDLSDWGLGDLKSGDWAVCSTWVPTISGIPYIVEDNHNPAHGGNLVKGVHIKGTSGYAPGVYDEPKVQLKTGVWTSEPYGGEKFDLEAYYFQQDADNIYVAIVTSVNPAGNPPASGDSWPGDLAMNFASVAGESFNHEWGIQLGTTGYHQQWDLIYLPEWQGYGYTNPPRPDIMKGILPGGYVVPGDVNGITGVKGAYTDSWLAHPDNGENNWVVEVQIPKSVVGLSGQSVGMNTISLADNCLNEDIYVPEFPTIAVAIGSLMSIGFVVFMVRQKNQ